VGSDEGGSGGEDDDGEDDERVGVMDSDRGYLIRSGAFRCFVFNPHRVVDYK
jgi:hypothetical protein